MAPVPEDDFDAFIEAAETAANTELPQDDFDENPFGHNLGMDDEPEDQTVVYTNAQIAGPPDVVWLSAEEQGCFRHTDSEEEEYQNIRHDAANK